MEIRIGRAHELRTPLAVLRGEIESLQDGIRAINAQTLHSLHAEVMALTRIVEDLSLIARTESGIMAMEFTPVDPVQVLEATIRRFLPRFKDRSFHVDKRFHMSVPVLIKGNSNQLDRVFSRNDLIAMVQGYGFEGYDRTIDSHIKNLRKKIGRHLPGEKVIHTVYRVGYKLSLKRGIQVRATSR